MRCVIEDCQLPVVAEVDCLDFGVAYRLFYGRVLNRKTQSRREGDPHILICESHLASDSRAGRVGWQWLLFAMEV
jgi:hypothetical protein